MSSTSNPSQEYSRAESPAVDERDPGQVELFAASTRQIMFNSFRFSQAPHVGERNVPQPRFKRQKGKLRWASTSVQVKQMINGLAW
ncbi:hypothetical protein V5O48_014505 [Marasmius crinis-equi]|uniref:Uncharacterized protein n=1 Tax=Marasmius crinis-equi TaxID=585013 RepID=A0ABR3EX48_9AGAR